MTAPLKARSLASAPSLLGVLLATSATAAALLVTGCGDSMPKPVAPEVPEAGVPETPKVDTPDASAAPSTDTPAATTPATPKNYRLVVSIISKGAGVDAKGKDQVTGIFNKWRISKGAELKTERPKWGKEGEMDICSDLAELSDADRTKLIGEVKAAVGKNDRFVVTENGTCHEDKGEPATTDKPVPKNDKPAPKKTDKK